VEVKLQERVNTVQLDELTVEVKLQEIVNTVQLYEVTVEVKLQERVNAVQLYEVTVEVKLQEKVKKGKEKKANRKSEIKESRRIKIYLFMYLFTYTLYKSAVTDSGYAGSKLRMTKSDLDSH
jgi:hypothetical protein